MSFSFLELHLSIVTSPFTTAAGGAIIITTWLIVWNKFGPRRAAAQRVVDPREDGWSTEVYAERAKKVLSEIVKRATSGAAVDATWLTAKVSPDFRGNPLRPAESCHHG